MAAANITQIETRTPITASSALPGRGSPMETCSSRIVTRSGTSPRRREQPRARRPTQYDDFSPDRSDSKHRREAEREDVRGRILRFAPAEREVAVVVKE